METIKEMAERFVEEFQTLQLKNFYDFLYALIEKCPYSIDELIAGLQLLKENNEKDLVEFQKSVDETPEVIKPKTK